MHIFPAECIQTLFVQIPTRCIKHTTLYTRLHGFRYTQKQIAQIFNRLGDLFWLYRVSFVPVEHVLPSRTA